MSHGAPLNVIPILELLPRDMEGKRVLDVGLGCGEVSQIIASYSGHYWVGYSGMPYIIGLDIDPQCVNFARKWLPYYREVYQRDATEIPYPPEIIRDLDVILCTEVSEHLTDKAAGLRMVEYLSDKARLVVFTCPLGFDEETVVSPDKAYMNHNSAWYPEDFTRFGFKVKKIGVYGYGCDRKIVKAINILNLILRRPRSTHYIFAYKVNGA